VPTCVSIFCNSVILVLDVIAVFSCVGVAVSALQALSVKAHAHANKILMSFISNLIYKNSLTK